jgi:phosphate:Na+ symporter
MLTLLNLLSALAMLVWGAHLVRTGVLRVYGADLRRILSTSTKRRGFAFMAGLGVTSLVQSSNATSVLVCSFVAQGLISLAPALAIMLGADVGTALMTGVLSFDLPWLSPLLIFCGVIVHLSHKQKQGGQLGRVAIGLGLITLALQLIAAATRPMTQMAGIEVLFSSLTGDVMLDALIGALFAMVTYSSLAAVLLAATLATSGVISRNCRFASSTLGRPERGPFIICYTFHPSPWPLSNKRRAYLFNFQRETLMDIRIRYNASEMCLPRDSGAIVR